MIEAMGGKVLPDNGLDLHALLPEQQEVEHISVHEVHGAIHSIGSSDGCHEVLLVQTMI